MYSAINIVNDCVSVLKSGGVILYPTDTIWGLGCDINDESAVETIYRIKQRDRNKPMILLAGSIEMMNEYLDDLHPRVETLLVFHRKPLTLVGRPTEKTPKYLWSEQGTIAIRFVQDTFCQHMISAFGRPIISTSANISNEPFPKGFEHITQTVKEKVDYIVPLKQNIISDLTPSVLAKYDYRGNLIFLRT